MKKEKIQALIKELRQHVKDNPAPLDITFYVTKQEFLAVCERYEIDPKPYLEKFFND